MSTDNPAVAEKNKLTDNQLRILQIVIGIFSAAALVASIYLPRLFVTDSQSLLNYVFVVVFLAITFGRRSIENKYRLRLGLFSLCLMIGILAGVIFFAASLLYAPEENAMTGWSVQAKTLTIAGLSLLLVLAVIVPLVRYFKRKANGTLPPIRLPEKEPDKTAEAAPDEIGYDGPVTVEQKIDAMIRELDEKEGNE